MTFNHTITAVRPTVSSLFNAYLASLANRGARSLNSIRNILTSAQAAIGGDCLASEVSSEAICSWLSQIYARGAAAHTDRARAILKAAFNFGMKARFDYRTSNGMNWGIKSNPTNVIPVDRGASSHVRTRFLDRDELTRFHRHIINDMENPAARVLIFCLLTGCRIEESQIKIKNLDLVQAIVYWKKTKTGKPHQIAIGNRLLSYLKGWCEGRDNCEYIIQSAKDPSKPVSCDTVIKYFNRLGFAGATPRDACRRTFKTMGQVAGVELGVLDLIQNHTNNRSVSMLCYNRFSLTYEAMEMMKNSLNQWEERIINF